jgi:hypothetical protein
VRLERTLSSQMMAVCCKKRTTLTNSLCGQNTDCLALNLAVRTATTRLEGTKNAVVTASCSHEGCAFRPLILFMFVS